MTAKHSPTELVELAHKHLWIYFSQLKKSGELAVIERGEGSYVFDDKGKRYIDGLARLFLSPRLFELGLICRAEDKGEPVVQLSPPLVAGAEEFRAMARILRQALGEAGDRIS